MNKLQEFFFQKINSRVAIIIILILAIFIGAESYWLSKSISIPESNKGVLPPEKQAIENRYNQERAAGEQNPAVPNPNAPAPYPDVENPTPNKISDIKDWKTYHYSKFGISFKYPPEYTIKIDNGGGLIISYPVETENNFVPNFAMYSLMINILPFTTEFSVSAGESKLYYNNKTNHWILDGVPSCELITPLGGQAVQSSFVGDGRAEPGHSAEYAVILKQGLLHFSFPEDFFEEFKVVVDTVTFDNPDSVIKARCD